MHLEFTLVADDLLEMQKSFSKAKLGMSLNLLLLASAIAILSALVFLALPIETESVIVWAIAMAILPVAFLLRSRRIRAKCRKTIAETPSFNGLTTVEVSEQGLAMTAPGSRGESTWDAYISYLETQNLFLIFMSPKMARVLPKRAFGSDEDRQALRSLLATHIGAVFPKKRPARVAGDIK